MALKVVYVAGTYRAPTPWQISENIRRARLLSLDVWRAGAVAICPHANTALFDGELPDDVWLNGDLEILKRCDAVLLTSDWARSEGARAEKAYADSLGLPVFRALDELQVWIKVQQERGRGTEMVTR